MNKDCSNCSHCASCKKKSSDYMYMYRNLKGVTTFTGFVTTKDGIIWIGKDEKAHRRINTDVQADINFFMTEMKQYDK